jgi:hypothetical protein
VPDASGDSGEFEGLHDAIGVAQISQEHGAAGVRKLRHQHAGFRADWADKDDQSESQRHNDCRGAGAFVHDEQRAACPVAAGRLHGEARQKP